MKRILKTAKRGETVRFKVGSADRFALAGGRTAHDCATDQKYCAQTEPLRAARHDFPVLDVYVAEIPKELCVEPVLPPLREREIASTNNLRLRRQKYAVWRLLEYGLKGTFGYSLNRLSFTREQNGKWRCGECEFSLSHYGNAVAVALSNKPVGIDIESVRAVKDERLARKILTARELSAYGELSSGREEYLLLKWTQKESLFKRSGGKVFCPSKTETGDSLFKTERISVAGEELLLTVSSDDFANFRLFDGIGSV